MSPIIIESTGGWASVAKMALDVWVKLVRKAHKPTMVRFVVNLGHFWAIAVDEQKHVLAFIGLPEKGERQPDGRIVSVPLAFIYGQGLTGEEFTAEIERLGVKGGAVLIDDKERVQDITNYPNAWPFYQLVSRGTAMAASIGKN